MRKRILSILLALCMILVGGVMPTTAFADGDGDTNTGKAIQLGTSQIEGGQADSIYFGNYKQSSDGNGGYNIDPIKWRVLSNADGKLFLLTDQNLDAKPYNNKEISITWETSTIRSWLNGYGASANSDKMDYSGDNFIYTAFSGGEQNAIADTYVYNATQSDGSSKPNPQNDTSGGSDTTDKIFLLSIEEATNSSYYLNANASRKSTDTAYVTSQQGNYAVNKTGFWWLRSPGSNGSWVACVMDNGGIDHNGLYAYFGRPGIRPAFNLNPDSVLFTSPATGGKADVTVDETLTAVTDYSGNEWKLTVKDSNRSFSANAASDAALTQEKGYSDWKVNIEYSGAQTGDNEYVSAMLCDSNDNVLYYGNIAQGSASGTATVNIPSGLAVGSYSLKVFSEQCNGDKKTDYASDFQDISLTVAPKTYTVSFDANGGGGTMSNVTVVYDTYYTLPGCGFTAPDDTLEFGKWVVDEASYAPGEPIRISGNVTAKATWREITYHITITDKNGNKVQITQSNCHDVLGDGTVSYTPPTVDGTRTYTDMEIEKAILGEQPIEGLQPAVLTLKDANLQQIWFEEVDWPYGGDSAKQTTANLLRFPTVKLEGESTITNPDERQIGIAVSTGMIITGDGSLTVNTNGNKAIAYGIGGLYLQKGGTVTLNARSYGIKQNEPISLRFWGGKLTIQVENPEDEYGSALSTFEGFSMADNATLWLGDSADTNCIRVTPPTGDERWQDAIIRQWETIDSENYMPHYLQLTSAYTVTLNANGGTFADGKNITKYTYGEGATLPTERDMTYTGYTFKGWYDNEGLTGSPVTAISNTEIGNKEYWAKWEKVTHRPTTQRPEITIIGSGKVTLSTNGRTATIAADEGHELASITLNGKEVANTDNLTGLKTGDKVVVTFREKADESAAEIKAVAAKVGKIQLIARSGRTAKNNVRITVKTDNETNSLIKEIKDLGYTVKYKYYRSTKKSSAYTAKLEKNASRNSYINTAGKKGTRYYYKVRLMVYDAKGNLVAKTELKQCKYAARIWNK